MTPKPQPYVYQEFPKWVTLPDGSQKVVHSAQEEQQATQTSAAPKRRGRPPKAPSAA